MTGGRSTVSVVVPCFNYGRYLGECLDSILSQVDVDVEVLVIDDGSTDGSATVAASLAAADSRVEVRVHDTNVGHIATYNEGLLGWARGDYSVLISADDRLAPGALARACAVMAANPGVGLVYGRSVYVLDDAPVPDPEPERGRPHIWFGQEWLRAVCGLGHSVISSPEVVVRTSLQQRLGGYRADLPHTGDLDMWLRFAAHADVAYVRADQAYYRRHASNMTRARKPLVDLEQRLAAFDSVLAAHGGRIRDAERIHRKVHHKLAREALWTASRAYDRGRTGEIPVEALCAFALAASPVAHRSREALGLRWRRRVGPGIAPYFQPLVVGALARKIRDRLWWRRWAAHGL